MKSKTPILSSSLIVVKLAICANLEFSVHVPLTMSCGEKSLLNKRNKEAHAPETHILWVCLLCSHHLEDSSLDCRRWEPCPLDSLGLEHCCTRLSFGSTHRANDRYKDRLDGQLTNLESPQPHWSRSSSARTRRIFPPQHRDTVLPGPGSSYKNVPNFCYSLWS